MRISCQLSVACPESYRRVSCPRSRLQRGVTLVELLIYMALVAIFIITLTDIFSSTLAVRTESEATSAVDEDGRFILARLIYDINRAQTVTAPATLGTTTPNLDLTIPGTTYAYALNASNLQLTENGQPNNLNSSESSISNLSFQRIGNPLGKPTLKIQFTVASKTQRAQGAETKTYNTTVGLR